MPIAETVFLTVFWLWALSAACLLGMAVPSRRTPQPLPNSELITFAATDGLALSGALLRGHREAPWIILCHAFGGQSGDHAPVAELLNRRGFNLLVFDFRAHGGSSGFSSSFGYRELNDIYGALSYLSQQHDPASKPIGIYGISMGASAAIMAAACDERLGAVLADSPYSSLRELLKSYFRRITHLPALPFLWLLTSTYRIRFGAAPSKVAPIAAVAALSPRPLLLIAGKRDRRTPLRGIQDIYDAARQPKEIWITESAHGSAASDHPEEYLDRVGRFFVQSLGWAGIPETGSLSI